MLDLFPPVAISKGPHGGGEEMRTRGERAKDKERRGQEIKRKER